MKTQNISIQLKWFKKNICNRKVDFKSKQNYGKKHNFIF